VAIQKLKEESRKREIPEELVEAVIQMSLRDMNKLKPAVYNLLVYVVDRIPNQDAEAKELKNEISSIVSELLFPDSINQREFGTFMADKIMSFFINKLKLDEY